MFMAQGKKEEAEEAKKLVAQQAQELADCEAKETELSEKIKKIMMIIPNIIDPAFPSVRMIRRMLRFRNTVNP